MKMYAFLSIRKVLGFLFVFELGTEFSVSSMLGKCSATEVYSCSPLAIPNSVNLDTTDLCL
jgi:hypothetical protein